MYIDAHTHLIHYGNNLDKALKQINDYKIMCIDNAMNIEYYKKSLEISKNNPYIISTFGIHPWEAYKYSEKLTEIDKFINISPMIGEIGLDFYWEKDRNKYKKQIRVLKYFLKKSNEQDKVVNLHTKGAESYILKLLDEYKISKAIIHWYSGDEENLKKMIEKGYYFTISSEVLYSEKIKNITSIIPLNRILTETDGPSAEKWLSGKIGMPKSIVSIVKKISRIKGVNEEEVTKKIIYNYNNIVIKNINVKNLIKY